MKTKPAFKICHCVCIPFSYKHLNYIKYISTVYLTFCKINLTKKKEIDLCYFVVLVGYFSLLWRYMKLRRHVLIHLQREKLKYIQQMENSLSHQVKYRNRTKLYSWLIKHLLLLYQPLPWTKSGLPENGKNLLQDDTCASF